MYRVVIAVGGTGGHVFPALALAQQLKERATNVAVSFIGGRLQNNRYFSKGDFPFTSVCCAPLSAKNPLSKAKEALELSWGIGQSLWSLQRSNPDLVVGFGSYYSFGPLLAAKILRIPFALHEANTIPGKVNRWFSPHAEKIGIFFPQTKVHLSGDCSEVGLPLRKGFSQESVDCQKAFQYFDLDPDSPVLLIFGGSQGALKLNHLTIQAIEILCKNARKPFQIIHLTGSLALQKEAQSVYQRIGIKAVVKEFEQSMELAWAIADFVICRSGAGSIAEQIEFCVPGLLIPYPYASDKHQQVNANFMVDTVQGALMRLEDQLTAEEIAVILHQCFVEKIVDLKQMRRNIQNQRLKLQQSDFCDLIQGLLVSGARKKV